MFQTFDDVTDPSRGAERVARLREELAQRGLDGFVVPHADEHQSEYLPASAERLFWLTGFSGSAGAAVVLRERAAIFVDGRYTLQVFSQVDARVFEVRPLHEEPPSKWLEAHAAAGQRIGFDPWLHTIREREQLERACARAGVELVAVEGNPIDAIWTDRPAPPALPVELHGPEFAGEEAGSKIARIAQAVREAGAAAAVLTMAESIAWLLNIRGRDVAHKPLALANAILPAQGKPQLFIAGEKLSNAARAHLADLADIDEPSGFLPALRRLGETEQAVLVDPAATPSAVAEALQRAGADLRHGTDPCALPRAIKNETEIAGARAAQRRDGVAMARFLAWLDREAPSGEVDEIGAARMLEHFRSRTGALMDISFDTISGAGPNGAIVHYRVSETTNRRLVPNSLYLVDSGGQYRDGTTDVTRTVAIGTPTREMRERFTLVLKGMVALSTARFPKGTTGGQLDALARLALWAHGLDYDHGTGHGVGSFLGVHEGPQRIAKRGGDTPLKPGMILSNEPGYYKTGEYGIRIENLILVTAPEEITGGERAMMGFETLTFVPIDRRLIEPTLLGEDNVAWLDAYHARVREMIGPELEGADRAWLDQATAPLSR
jgi:Xaa-Pro aminopeptidase